MNTEAEMDLNLKLRLMRLFWFNGYLVRKNVNLLRFEFGRKTEQQYTDIDVVCMKYDNSFNKKIEICDCKSGQTAKSAERIFWLSGVMKYFGADKGYFVRSQMMESRYVDLSNKLEIFPLSEPQLTALEKSYNVYSKPFLGCFNKDSIMYENDTFIELKKANLPVYEYITYRYWNDTAQQQIISLIDCGNQIKNLKLRDDSKLFISMYILTMLTYSILEFSQFLLLIPEEEQEHQIRERLLGGKLESYEKVNLLKKFYNFMTKEIKIRYDSKYPITRDDFLSHFYPPYTKYLTDLIQRICLNPKIFVAAPRFLDFWAYEIILNQNKLNKDILLEIFGKHDIHDLLKAVKDLIVFSERSEFFESAQAKVIIETITKIQNECVT